MSRRFHFLNLRLLREGPADPNEPAPRRKYRNTQRRTVLRVATSLFGEHGFHGASVDAIARRAGVHKPSVFYHFPTKEALYDAAVEHAGTTVLARFFAAIDGADATEPRSVRSDRLAEALADAFELDPIAARLLLRDAMDAGVREGQPHLAVLADALLGLVGLGATEASAAQAKQLALTLLAIVVLPFATAATLNPAQSAARRAHLRREFTILLGGAR
jgi:AcrR family transcriptional regulator